MNWKRKLYGSPKTLSLYSNYHIFRSYTGESDDYKNVKDEYNDNSGAYNGDSYVYKLWYFWVWLCKALQCSLKISFKNFWILKTFTESNVI